LADSSYEIINTSLNEPLGHSSSAKIPPDWIMIERSTGRIKPPSQETLTSNFSYDALRVPFRLALDWKWFQDPRAKAALNNMGFLSREWNSRQTIYSGYSHDGQAVSVHENPSMYGGSIGYFMVADPENASEVFDKKLKTLYNNDNFDWKETLSYYDDNWAWFGIALYYEELTNLYRKGQNDSAT
ncbi:MAG TPA: hypothetical protein VD998_03310, partial [Verrucomicrobiae bacterium]|nr:hypothetical protein [Verrucomicrobiae bacterium]